MKCNVILVDDNPYVRRALAREIGKEFEVIAAATFTDAIHLLRPGCDVAAVVTDLDLGPGPGGQEILAEARRVVPDAARVLVTGSPLPEKDAAQILRKKLAHTLVAKPWANGEVLKAVRSRVAEAIGLIL